MYKVDLHTHSVASPDGSLTLADYRSMLDSGELDYIAVTDHDSVAWAFQARSELGERLIVGEEISTTEGELIGLFLGAIVPPGLSPVRTAELIRQQGGLVYVPHPFETVRHGLSQTTLAQLAGLVDIVEVFNGRAVAQNKSANAKRWAAERQLAGAASSDAHGRRGWGKTLTVIGLKPTLYYVRLRSPNRPLVCAACCTPSLTGLGSGFPDEF